MAKSCQAEHAAQKARREAKEKAWEEAERQRVVEEEERKRRTMEYLQRLWDKVLEENATLLEGAKESKVVGFKCKEVATRNKEEQWPSKKARGKQLEKYHGGTTVNIGGSNPYKRCVCARQDFLVYPSR